MKVVVIRDTKGNPLFAAKVEEIGELEFIKVKKECEKNRALQDKVHQDEICALAMQINEVDKDVKVLKGED